MAIEYIKDLDTLFNVMASGEVIIFAYGSTGVAVINLMHYTKRANACVVVQESKSAANKFLYDIPLIHLGVMPHFRETATFIVAAPSNRNALYHGKLANAGCKKIFCLTDDVHKAIAETLRKLQSAGAITLWFMNYFTEKLKRMEYQFNLQNEVCRVNSAAFESYRNCYRDKEVVIVGTGATAAGYKPIPDAIHIALDKACQRTDITFNHLFTHNVSAGGADIEQYFEKITDKIFVGKFSALIGGDEYSEQITVSSDKVARYFTNDNVSTQLLYRDICTHTLAYFGGAFGAALQFAAFTYPASIRLVGCELPKDASVTFKKVGYTRLRMLINKFYPDINIISVDPIELKGLFNDVFTKNVEIAK